jgi:hypothetical protein
MMFLCALLCCLQAWSHWGNGKFGLAMAMACAGTYVLGMWTVIAVHDFGEWYRDMRK